MKITTEKMTIETNAEELRQSNGLADSFSRLLREIFNGSVYSEEEEDEEGGEHEED